MSARCPAGARWWLRGVIALGLVAAGCGGSPSAPAPADKLAAVKEQGGTAGTPKPPMPTVAPRIPEPGPPLPPLSYEAKNRRDPFVPITPVIEKSGGLNVIGVQLVGIIEGRQPLALVEAPGGLGYILKPGDMLGNGRVTAIGPGSVTFAIGGRPGEQDTTVTLRLVRE